jgi:hypothetical protein
VSPGDAIHWTNPKTGKSQPGLYNRRWGSYYEIRTKTPSGYIGLRYVQPEHVRPATESTAEHP